MYRYELNRLGQPPSILWTPTDRSKYAYRCTPRIRSVGRKEKQLKCADMDPPIALAEVDLHGPMNECQNEPNTTIISGQICRLIVKFWPVKANKKLNILVLVLELLDRLSVKRFRACQPTSLLLISSVDGGGPRWTNHDLPFRWTTRRSWWWLMAGRTTPSREGVRKSKYKV